MALSPNNGIDLEKLIRPELIDIASYASIDPPEVLGEQAGIPTEQVIKLDGNENPYGCSPRVQQALAAYDSYHVYPDPFQRELRHVLEEYTGIDQKYIVTGSGSDELIDLVGRLFLRPGDKVINCVPTFGMYSFCAGVCGSEVLDVQRNTDYEIDVEAIMRSTDARTKLIFIASPNNPTGNITLEADIVALLNEGLIVLVDEAYYEFCGDTVAHLVARHDNLFVLRTFSKWAGLASLRVGYGFFPLKVAAYLQKIKPPYNVNAAGLVAAKESLADIDYVQRTVKAIIEERGRLFTSLQQLSLLRVWPSKANFILCSVLRGEAKELQQRLRQRGIFVRHFDTPPVNNCLRISVGKPEHTDALIKALNEIGDDL